MLSSSLLATALALFTAAHAAPAPFRGGPGICRPGRPGFPHCDDGRGNAWAHPPPKCMSDAEADTIAGVFQQLIQGYTKEMALAVLTEDFVDYSSAVSIVINKGAAVPNDITQPIFTSREQFMQGHGKQKPIPFETQGVWHNCNGTVFMKWETSRSALGQATEAAAIPVPGLVILETHPAEPGNAYPYRIHTIHSEFNSAAWLVNLGVFDPVGATTPVPAAKRAAVPDEPLAFWEVGAL